MKRASLWLAVAAIGALALAGQAQSHTSRSSLSSMTLLRRADASMSATRKIHRVIGRTYPGRFYRLDARHPDATYALWAGRLHRARKAMHRPPHRGAWECIQRYEGRWDDDGGPYYGGLQMDWSFMRAYGGWLLAHRGTADRWTPLEQMWVAENAFRAGRGFYPWPSTARMCGLI